nr:hypothetical protein [Aeromonas salmonicida subsp. salmonicida]UVY98996.1 hypothetical protein [Aeromonas salmonicida subsp. salmonicida]
MIDKHTTLNTHYVKNDRIHENHQNCAGWFTYRLDMGSEGQ